MLRVFERLRSASPEPHLAAFSACCSRFNFNTKSLAAQVNNGHLPRQVEAAVVEGRATAEARRHGSKCRIPEPITAGNHTRTVFCASADYAIGVKEVRLLVGMIRKLSRS